jgi:hypothetical protein
LRLEKLSQKETNMPKQGQLKVESGVSTLNGTTLARQGAGDPFGAATNFLANRGLNHNDFIRVEGSDGFVSNVPVFFITAAGPLTAVKAAQKSAATAAVKSGGKKPAAKKPAAKKSGTKKESAKRGGAKKSGSKTATAKRSSAKRRASKKSQKGSRKRQ